MRFLLAITILLFGCDERKCIKYDTYIDRVQVQIGHPSENLLVFLGEAIGNKYTTLNCVGPVSTFYNPYLVRICQGGYCNSTRSGYVYMKIPKNEAFKNFYCYLVRPSKMIWDDHPSEPAPIGEIPEKILTSLKIEVVQYARKISCRFCSEYSGTECTEWN